MTNLYAYSQIEKLSGPRVGITFITEGQISDYINEGLDFDEDENKGYGNTGFSYTTQYGWQWETKFSDGGNIVGIVEWVALIAGLEKGMFLPSASSFAPGPSPIIIIFELIFPSAKTRLVAFFFKAQFLIRLMFFFNFSSFSDFVPVKLLIIASDVLFMGSLFNNRFAFIKL